MVTASFLTLAILFSPLFAAILILVFLLKSPKLASGTAITGILTSLACSVFLLIRLHSHADLPFEVAWRWIDIAGLQVEFGFLVDSMTLVMLMVVTIVASCVFLYSTAYMHGDSSYPRYFASLSLFAFSMLGIVLANNFLMLFIFWELVAVSSYLLIGFWFEKPSAAEAANKAFIVNRVADFGMVLGIFFVWSLSGVGVHDRTFSFTQLEHIFPQIIHAGLVPHWQFIVAALLVFCGVIGKSAQFPLYVWLPDAMEGPTPVSALIHAATMVAAGVYMMSRCFFIVAPIHEALVIMAYIGAITALLAALLAVVQNDIKKILAYSTISQLGFMVIALGMGGSHEAMYHLTTHAFFKALLFLGAGAMIHHLHTQDIWEMGGLLKSMPVTAITFIIGTLALCGIPPLSGFFSKDEILALAFEHNKIIYVMASAAAGLTAFYMTRAICVAVLGPERKKAHSKHAHAHHEDHHDHSEAPMVMKAPLALLAVLAVISGFIGIPGFLANHGHEASEHAMNWTVALVSTLIALGGILISASIYLRVKNEDPLKKTLKGFYEVLVQKYYLDAFFFKIADFFDKSFAGVLYWFDENVVIRRGVNGTAEAASRFCSVLRWSQSGRLQSYATIFSFGVIILISWMMLKG